MHIAHAPDGDTIEEWDQMMLPPGVSLPRTERDDEDLRRYTAAEHGETSCAWFNCEMLRRRRGFEEADRHAMQTRASQGDEGCTEDRPCGRVLTNQLAEMATMTVRSPARRAPLGKR
jgi:hypothetical protein